MEKKIFKSDLLLLLTAFIWGTAFVAQRVGMEHVGPFVFNGIRFILGGACLLPFIVAENRRRTEYHAPNRKQAFAGYILAGLMLFAGSSLQQVGIVYTTAGKAGFITGLYVVIVPLLGLVWGQKVRPGSWVGAVIAAGGLYFLSISNGFSIAYGDLLVLIGAFAWALHVQAVGLFSPRMSALRLAFGQYMVCGGLSLLVALIAENNTLGGIMAATMAIVYGGVFSVGIAYTLQVFAQKDAPAAHAAIILSLETVFAALGGWIVLGETLSGRAVFGCVMMLSGMLLSQLDEARR